MIHASLQFGPFDGYTGDVPDEIPLALDVRRCLGTACDCGRPLHYRRVSIAAPSHEGFARYELVDIDEAALRAMYRHAETMDPREERALTEAFRG